MILRIGPIVGWRDMGFLSGFSSSSSSIIVLECSGKIEFDLSSNGESLNWSITLLSLALPFLSVVAFPREGLSSNAPRKLDELELIWNEVLPRSPKSFSKMSLYSRWSLTRV